MRTNELPSLACLLYISFALLFVSIFLAAHAASWPAAAAGGAVEQLDCAIYNFAAIYQGDVCALYLLSHTHTQIQEHSHTRCGLAHLAVSRGGRQARCPPLPYRSPLPGLASWHGDFSSFPRLFFWAEK